MKNKQKVKINKRLQRKKRVRAKIKGTAKRPRICVSRTVKHIFVQIIDDDKGVTLLSAHDNELKGAKAKSPKLARAKEVGKLIAKKAIDKKVKSVVFDRGGRPYHGRIKAVAEGAREGGLSF